MGKQGQHIDIEDITIASATVPIGATQRPRFKATLDRLSGDMLVRKLMLRYNGILNNTGGGSTDGTAVTDGHHKFLRALKVFSDKGDVVFINDLSGLVLHRILTMLGGTRPDHVQHTSANNQEFSSALDILFALGKPEDDVLRDLDTIVDVKKQTLKIEALFGIFADLVSGSDRTSVDVDDGILNVAAEVINAPKEGFKPRAGDDPGDMPQFYRNFEMLASPDVTNASNTFKIKIPYNDRIYRGIYLFQMNSSTLLERTDIITGTQRVSLKVNGFPWFEKRRWRDLTAENKRAYRLETRLDSVVCLDFARTGKIADQLAVLSKDSGTAELECEVTGSLSNAQLWVVGDSLKPLPDAVQR